MVEASELLSVPVFAGLPDDQIAWFISQSHELVLKPDDVYVHQGDPADGMFVVLEGQLLIRGDLGGEMRSLAPMSSSAPVPNVRILASLLRNRQPMVL